MITLLNLLYIVLTLAQRVLTLRIELDVVGALAPQWRPRGIVLVLASAVAALTDRPLAAVRRVVPPLQLGGIALDLAFIVLYLAVSLAKLVLRGIA